MRAFRALLRFRGLRLFCISADLESQRFLGPSGPRVGLQGFGIPWVGKLGLEGVIPSYKVRDLEKGRMAFLWHSHLVKHGQLPKLQLRAA